MTNENRSNRYQIEEDDSQPDEQTEDYARLKLTREELAQLFEKSSSYVMKP